MNEALFNLRFDELGQSSRQKYANKPRKENKTNEQNNRERKKGNPKSYVQYKA